MVRNLSPPMLRAAADRHPGNAHEISRDARGHVEKPPVDDHARVRRTARHERPRPLRERWESSHL